MWNLILKGTVDSCFKGISMVNFSTGIRYRFNIILKTVEG